MSTKKNAGVVTAYGAAVQAGYEGSYEDFCAAMADLGIQVGYLENMSVTVTMLNPDESPSASYADGALTLNIPRGNKGDKGDKGNTGNTGATGATPNITIGTVTTGAAGTDAAATMTGTAENPVLSLTIPKGADGDVSAASMATAYSASATYAVGDYVWYSGQLYRCTTAITTAEAWTAGHWAAAKLAEDVTSQSEKIGKINDIVEPKSPNLFDSNWDASGYIDDGVDKSGSSFKRTSKFYPIEGQSSGSLYAVVTEIADLLSVSFFDSTKAWISNANVNNTLTKTLTIPNGAKYFRSYTRATYTGNLCLSLTPVTSYVPYDRDLKLKDETVAYDNLADDLSNLLQLNCGTNIFDGNYDASGYIDDGVDKSSSNFVRTSNFYPVDATKGTLYVYHQNSGTISMLFFDSSKAWIKNVNIGSAGTTTVDIPSNAAYYRSYKNVSVTDGITISYTYVSSYIPYEEHPDIKDDSITYSMLTDDVKERLGVPLIGKTIAFMGDSIIGNFYDSTGICAILAEKTGATVINCAFGGTRMAYNHGESVQYTYMNAISGAGLAGAIASGTWTDQDAAIAGLTGVPDYFSARLATIKAIDWAEVDFIMWEYGTNDFANGIELSDTSDTTNLYAYDNAYRYVIETILTEYPNIRIITATPAYRWYQSGGSFTEDSNTHTETDYAGATHKLTDFVEMAKTVSKEYQIPCIDDYYTLGANRYTRLAYFDSTDGTHPNANGRKRLAEHIASQLMSLV